MKTIKALLAICLFTTISLQSQNITNTLGTGGTFTIKSSAANFFTLNQSTGNAVFLRNIELGNIVTSNSTAGMLTKNGISFLHNYAPVGADGNNTFVGLYSGNQGMSGTTGQSSNNTGIGFGSLFLNTTGSRNTGLGAFTLLYNTESVDNTSVGYRSLNLNTTGSANTAVGSESLLNNTIGYENISIGRRSLQYNTAGYRNTVIGTESMYNNSTGSYNTAIGWYAGDNIFTGNNNIAIGNFTYVPSGSASNQIRLGNTSITYAGIQVAWTVTSDRRLKKNILSSNLGLSFINKLRPVSYIRINDESERTEYGLIAQEVEDALKQEQTENTGMLTVTDDGEYQLRYNDLLAPMIKAIQELKAENEELKKRIDNLEQKNSQLTNSK